MECRNIEDLLSPYLDGELSFKEKQTVVEHLEVCKNCSSLFSMMKELTESMVDFPEIEASEDLLNRLSEIPEKRKKFKFGFNILLRPALQPVVAVLGILLIATIFYIFHPNRNQINKTIDRQLHLGYSKIEKLYSKAESFSADLGEYKDNILVSLKSTKFFGRSGE